MAVQKESEVETKTTTPVPGGAGTPGAGVQVWKFGELPKSAMNLSRLKQSLLAVPVLNEVRFDDGELKFFVPLAEEVSGIKVHFMKAIQDSQGNKTEEGGPVRCLGDECCVCEATKKPVWLCVFPVFDLSRESIEVLSGYPSGTGSPIAAMSTILKAAKASLENPVIFSVQMEQAESSRKKIYTVYPFLGDQGSMLNMVTYQKAVKITKLDGFDPTSIIPVKTNEEILMEHPSLRTTIALLRQQVAKL